MNNIGYNCPFPVSINEEIGPLHDVKHDDNSQYPTYDGKFLKKNTERRE